MIDFYRLNRNGFGDVIGHQFLGESGIFNTPPEVDMRGLMRMYTEPQCAALSG